MVTDTWLKRRHLLSLALIGLSWALAAAVNQQLARESLARVGYFGEAVDAARPWWVELYDYAYGLTWARRIAAQVAPATLPDQERVTRLATWVFDRFMGDNPLLPVQEDHFFNVARRGYGYCDQLAHVLATLYWSAGYPTKLLMLRDAQGVSIHTVTQVNIQGRWVVVDPYFRVLLETPEGLLASVEDIVQSPALLDAYPKMAVVLTPADFQRGAEFTTLPYASLPRAAAAWVSWQRNHRAARQQRLQAQRYLAADGSEDGGPRNAQLVRRLQGLRRLDRARRHELFGEDAQAQALYTQILADARVPEHIRTIAGYWLARLAWRTEDAALCLQCLDAIKLSSALTENHWQRGAANLHDRCHAMLDQAWAQHTGHDEWGS